MIARRALLKLVGAAPIAATTAKAELASIVSTFGGAAALGGNAASSTILPQSPGGLEKLFGKTIAAQIRSTHERFSDDRYLIRDIRRNEYDADIAALRSTSRAYKARKQYERDMADQDLCCRVRQMMWG